MQPPAALSRHRERLEQHLHSLLDLQHPPALRRMLRYHLGWEDADGRPASPAGKRLRPGLTFLACEVLEGAVDHALPLAASAELVHAFSLVHDDVQDRDRTRHGRDTVWALWGEAQAINVGDALMAIAQTAIASSTAAGLTPEAALAANVLLANRTLEMVQGQIMDIEFEERMDVGEDDYLAMVSGKTGALFDAALGLGAIAAGAPQATIEAMGRCGRSLGTAFQIRDDALGVWGDEKRTGKKVAADIRRRKKSLPVIHSLATASPGQRVRLAAIYARDSVPESDVEWVLEVMDSVDARRYCAAVATAHGEAAMRELDSLGLAAERASELREAADFLLNRDY